MSHSPDTPHHSAPSASSFAPRIGLIGVNGYGRTHVRALADLAAAGEASPVAYTDVAPDAGQVIKEAFGRELPGYRSYMEMLAQEELDIVVVSTPIHLHAEMIEQAFEHGVSVLVEKPPVVTIQDVRRLLTIQERQARRTGHRPRCQVGFQTAGSPAVSALGRVVREGVLGEIEFIGAYACWRRADSYYARADWAGRLERQGKPVLDGTLTNPLAHSLMNCLLVAADDEASTARPRYVQAELYRCRPDIDGDDTSSVRITTENGRTIVLTTTLCAAEQSEPYIFAKGSRGTATAYYTSGRFRTDPAGLSAPVDAPVERSALLTDLMAAVRGETHRLRCSLESTENYVLALNGIYESAGRPALVPGELVEEFHVDGERFVHLRDVESTIETCAGQGLLFSEAGAPWARRTTGFDLTGYEHFDLARLNGAENP